MKNYYKTVLVATALSLLGPLQALALGDVTLGTGGDAIITVGGINLTLSSDGGVTSLVDSIAVNSESFDVTLSNNGSISIVSTDRRTMTFSQSGSQSQVYTSLACTSSNSTYTITNPTAGATNLTITVTPTTSTCSTGGGGSGSTGSGSTTGPSGGGAPPAPTVVTPAVVKPAVVTTVVPAITTPSPAVSSGGLSALATLKVGQSNPIVKLVQVILNLDSKTKVASAGAGSPGKETDVFGGLTVKAIQKLQIANGIKASDPEYGKLGRKTMLSLIQVLVDKVTALQAELAKQKALGN